MLHPASIPQQTTRRLAVHAHVPTMAQIPEEWVRTLSGFASARPGGMDTTCVPMGAAPPTTPQETPSAAAEPVFESSRARRGRHIQAAKAQLQTKAASSTPSDGSVRRKLLAMIGLSHTAPANVQAAAHHSQIAGNDIPGGPRFGTPTHVPPASTQRTRVPMAATPVPFLDNVEDGYAAMSEEEKNMANEMQLEFHKLMQSTRVSGTAAGPFDDAFSTGSDSDPERAALDTWTDHQTPNAAGSAVNVAQPSATVQTTSDECVGAMVEEEEEVDVCAVEGSRECGGVADEEAKTGKGGEVPIAPLALGADAACSNAWAYASAAKLDLHPLRVFSSTTMRVPLVDGVRLAMFAGQPGQQVLMANMVNDATQRIHTRVVSGDAYARTVPPSRGTASPDPATQDVRTHMTDPAHATKHTAGVDITRALQALDQHLAPS